MGSIQLFENEERGDFAMLSMLFPEEVESLEPPPAVVVSDGLYHCIWCKNRHFDTIKGILGHNNFAHRNMGNAFFCGRCGNVFPTAAEKSIHRCAA